MISYCSSDKGVFSVMTGHGIPKGMCVLHAGNYPATCERYGEVMTQEEARSEGIRQGYLIEFRETNSFFSLAAHWLAHKNETSFAELCAREEMDPDHVKVVCKRLGF